MTKKMKPFPYSIEEVGQIITTNINCGRTLYESLTTLGATLGYSAEAVRRYWNSYAMFHSIEYNNKLKKIVEV